MIIRDFVAFDFETANRNRHSICSVGMVFVKNGKIEDSLYQLINPEEEFDDFNISIHGINKEEVQEAPTFDYFYNSIKNRIENKIMVAHNLSFDGYAFRDNLIRYEIKSAYHQFLCTYQLSRKIMPGLPSYRLNSLCNHLGIELFNHHHALDDAKACAYVMLKLTTDFQITNLDELYGKTKIRPGEIVQSNYRSSFVDRYPERVDFKRIKIATDTDPNHPFFGKNMVFTGKLKLLSRKKAAELLAARGGIPQNNITSTTNYILLGDFKEAMIKGNKSSKLKKAETMIQEGKNLKIISEEDFMRML